MILATYNVNSIRVREERFLRWLSAHQPDVVCMQELKCTEDDFPTAKLRDMGYHAEILGQKTYNGVAIVSRLEQTEVVRGLGRKDLDKEARWIASTIDGVRVMCAYVPAGGGEVNSPKYSVKLDWLKVMIEQVAREQVAGRPMVLCGDFNIAPEERDVSLPDKWRGTAVFNDELTKIFQQILGLGLVDAFRLHHDQPGLFTWWDYHNLGYQLNEGLRIDHIFIPAEFEDRCYRAWVDWEERQGKKPSDHAPLMADFDWARVRSRESAQNESFPSAARGRSFIAPAEVLYGDDAGRDLIRDSFPHRAEEISADRSIRIRFANGFEEVLRWNYFPAGARHWSVDGTDQWHDLNEAPTAAAP